MSHGTVDIRYVRPYRLCSWPMRECLFIDYIIIRIVADGILIHFCYIFQRKVRFLIPCELSVRQMIHMKYQALFFRQNKKKGNQIHFRLLSATVVTGTAMIKCFLLVFEFNKLRGKYEIKSAELYIYSIVLISFKSVELYI